MILAKDISHTAVQRLRYSEAICSAVALFYLTSLPVRPPAALHKATDATKESERDRPLFRRLLRHPMSIRGIFYINFHFIYHFPLTTTKLCFILFLCILNNHLPSIFLVLDTFLSKTCTHPLEG